MTKTNSRRRVLAALAALGAGSLAAPLRAVAQQGGGNIASVPCRVSEMLTTLEVGKGSYNADASSADFAFYAPMRAEGDGIVLYAAEIGGAARDSVAAIKGRIVRDADGNLRPEALGFAWPHTALERDGQYYGIVQMSFDQNVPVGVTLSKGSTDLGSIVFPKDSYDVNQPGLTLDDTTRQTLFDALMGDEMLTVSLVAGGQVFSIFRVEGKQFRSFAEASLVAAMDKAKAQDASSPCTFLDDYDPDQLWTEGCFLTTACCTLIGLPDDCWELQALRHFRDSYLRQQAGGAQEIARYYSMAPAIARALAGSVDGRRRLLGLYWRVIVPAALLARLGLNRLAHRLYRRMMLDLSTLEASRPIILTAGA